MKILILGTSNSILTGGWTYGLREALPDADIRNRSVGASPGIQFAVNIDDDFSTYDYVLIDTLPNDEEYAFWPGYDVESWFQNILQELALVIASQTRLILIAISLRRYQGTLSSVAERRRDMARRAGVQIVEFSDMVSTYGRDIVNDDEMYEHSAHPKAAISFQIGLALGRELARGYPKPVGKARRTDIVARYSTWLAKRQFFSGNLDYRKNRLTSETFVLLDEGYSMALPPEVDLIGVALNTHGTSCALEFDGGEAGRAVVTAFFSRRPQLLQKIFLPVTHRLASNHLRILGVAPEGAVRGMMAYTENPRPDRGAAAAISHWLFRDRSPFVVPDYVMSEAETFALHRRIMERMGKGAAPDKAAEPAGGFLKILAGLSPFGRKA